MKAYERFRNPNLYPRLMVSQDAIKRAVVALGQVGKWIEALALIRSAYGNIRGEQASLAEAKAIYFDIMHEEPWERPTKVIEP